MTAPRSLMEGYAGVPLVRKLGIKAGATVALVGAPDGFEATLGTLPEGVTLRRDTSGSPEVTLWFCRHQEELERRIVEMVPLAGKGGLWILWPKKASGIPTDLTQVPVRKAGLAAGLVDFKISAVDENWTGLRFTRRKVGSPGPGD